MQTQDKNLAEDVQKTTQEEVVVSNPPQPPTKAEKVRATVKKIAKRWFIDAFTGMAQGLFVTLIAGTIIKTIGTIIGDNAVGRLFTTLGQIASILMGAGIGAGIASHLKASKLVIFASMVAGFVGAFSDKFIGSAANFTPGDITAISAVLGAGSPGNPIGAYVTALAATEVEGVASMAGNITNEVIGKLGIKNLSKGVKVDVLEGVVTVSLALNLKYNYNIMDVTGKVQEKVKNAVENMTGLEVADVNIKVAGVEMEKQD